MALASWRITGFSVYRRIYSAFIAALIGVLLFSGAGLAQQRTAPAAADADFEYRLGPGDRLRVIVFGEESLTGEFFVSGAGTIAFPLVGEIPVQGKTVPQIQSAIEDKLRDGYLKQPKVSAEVLNYRPFYILGEVMKPGTYPYTSGLTVLNAVATASGFTYRAEKRKVFIKRAAANVGEIEQALTPTTPVEPGDTIRSDKTTNALVGGKYYMNRLVAFTASYTYANLTTSGTSPGPRYTDNKFLLGTTLSF